MSGVIPADAGRMTPQVALLGRKLLEREVAAANRVGWLATSTWPPAVRR